MPEKERTKDVTPEEAVERPWASNDKLVFDERSAHGTRVAVIAEDALQESVNFTKQIHDQYLKREQAALENNRYTLNYLYGLYPEESLFLREMLKWWADEGQQTAKK